MRAFALVLLLTGCASVQEIDVTDSAITCLLQGKIVGAVRVNPKGQVTEHMCLGFRINSTPKPDSNT